MTDYLAAGFSQQTETRPVIVDGSHEVYSTYGRNYAKPGVTITKVKIRKAPAPNLEIFKRAVYLCPELKQTCHRPNAYDAFELPSLIGDERRPYKFSLASSKS